MMRKSYRHIPAQEFSACFRSLVPTEGAIAAQSPVCGPEATSVDDCSDNPLYKPLKAQSALHLSCTGG